MSIFKSNYDFHFIDSTEASTAIIENGNGYFNLLSAADISIQMKDTNTVQNLISARASYKKFLQTEVSDFTASDKKFLSEVFSEAFRLIAKLNPNLIPDDPGFIKIKTNHYGKDVYYTRGNQILIPEDIFEFPNKEKQLPVMLHEIWHLISRKDEDLKAKAYALIGFKPHGKQVRLPDFIQERILMNPDGLSMEYSIKLGKDEALPIITANEKKFRKEKEVFFDYLKFDLYSMDDSGEILVDSRGNTTLGLQETGEFFQKIGNNTQYIIHPDEIVADNFMLAVLANDNGDYTQFSPEGKKLLQAFMELFKG